MNHEDLAPPQLTVALDFDGCLHPYTRGWQGPIPDDEAPTPEAVAAVERLHDEGYRLVVFSTRASDDEGEGAIREWLERYDLSQYVSDVTPKKPAAIAYIDDRAVPFHGDWDDAVHMVDHLKLARETGEGGGSAWATAFRMIEARTFPPDRQGVEAIARSTFIPAEAPHGRCHRCNDLGLRSVVTQPPDPGVSSGLYQPSEQHWDEDGQWHSHDPDAYSGSYQCTQGHRWTETNQSPCFAAGCDFGHADSIIEYTDDGPGQLQGHGEEAIPEFRQEFDGATCGEHGVPLVTMVSMDRVNAGIGGPRPTLACPKCVEERHRTVMTGDDQAEHEQAHPVSPGAMTDAHAATAPDDEAEAPPDAADEAH